ncbi:MAG: response regulator [Planctomycetes bacterium]|nr:response regulator [Planctomycetota bacterium]
MTKRDKIVVIEDEADILEVLNYNLKREGYTVVASRNGEDGLDKVRRENPDLVLLDLMLPGLDGIEVCKRLQADPVTSNVPVIMVTAKGEESDVVLGLQLGADDYVTKPFSPKELLARVKAVLRRGPLRETRAAGERITRDGLVVDVVKHHASVDGEPLTLTATEMRLLHFLAAHPGRVFSRDQLLSRAIGDHAVVIDRNIDVHVGAIRRKLGRCRDLIETIRGVGYRFKDPDEE